VFITSTTRGLLPVKEIAGRALTGNGDVCERLRRAFHSYVIGDAAARRKSATENTTVSAWEHVDSVPTVW
jgi:hypothetical protein